MVNRLPKFHPSIGGLFTGYFTPKSNHRSNRDADSAANVLFFDAGFSQAISPQNRIIAVIATRILRHTKSIGFLSERSVQGVVRDHAHHCSRSEASRRRDREFWLSLASTWTALAIGIDYVGEAADRMRTRGG